MRSLTALLFLIGLLHAACTEDSPTNPATDTSPATDIAIDTQVIDAGEDTHHVDAHTASDTAVDTQTAPDIPQDIQENGTTSWGTITGACGVISAAVKEDSAAVLHTTYTFTNADTFDSNSLEGRAKKRYDEPNAGGSSKCSEVMSMQLLIDCEDAAVTKLETEIVYDTEGKIADYLIDIDGVKAGVSVTRAYKGPVIDVYTAEDATSLLEKKLAGIAEARENVSEEDSWDKSLVHIWTLYPEWAETVTQAWNALDDAIKGTTLVLVTVEQGSDYIVTDNCED